MVALQERARDVFKTPTQEGRMMRRRSHVTLAALTVLATLALATFASPALAAPETPETGKASAVTATTATLEGGVLNPNAPGEEGESEYRYRASETECEGESSTPPEHAVGNEKEAVPPVGLTNLQPNAHYTFCLIEHNNAGEFSFPSTPASFKTEALAPEVDSESTSAVTPFEATLSAQVNPNNEETTYSFEYSTEATGETLEGSITTLNGGSALPPEFGERTAEAHTGNALAPATTYFYRVVATNLTGTTTGKVEQFTTLTLEKPIIGSESVSGLTSTDATLNAQVNPNYQETTYSFEYSTEATGETLEGSITAVNGATSLPAEFAELPASKSTEALQPRTTYFYRVVATNSPGGTANGPVQSFTTPGTPIATTSAAQSVTRTTAALSGTVNPGGEPATFHFAYATAASYQPGAPNPYVKGATTPERASVGSDFTAHPAGPSTIGELQPGTTYHYALVATNPVGTVIGPDMQFTTAPPAPPLASTGEATGVSQLSATMNGSADTRELQTVAQFEFGTVPGAGSMVPASATPGAGSTETLTASFEGDLQPGTTYYYRTVATNVDGTGYGEERSFTTGTFPGQAGPAAVSLVAWPGFVLKELAGGIPPIPAVTGPKPLTKKQKLAKALKACNKKHGKKRAACRHQAKKRFR
jgi:hypothetical protein